MYIWYQQDTPCYRQAAWKKKMKLEATVTPQKVLDETSELKAKKSR